MRCSMMLWLCGSDDPKHEANSQYSKTLSLRLSLMRSGCTVSRHSWVTSAWQCSTKRRSREPGSSGLDHRCGWKDTIAVAALLVGFESSMWLGAGDAAEPLSCPGSQESGNQNASGGHGSYSGFQSSCSSSCQGERGAAQEERQEQEGQGKPRH